MLSVLVSLYFSDKTLWPEATWGRKFVLYFRATNLSLREVKVRTQAEIKTEATEEYGLLAHSLAHAWLPFFQLSLFYFTLFLHTSLSFPSFPFSCPHLTLSYRYTLQRGGKASLWESTKSGIPNCGRSKTLLPVSMLSKVSHHREWATIHNSTEAEKKENPMRDTRGEPQEREIVNISFVNWERE